MHTRQRHATLYQALGHPERLHILKILADRPACVCELVMLTGKRQPYISQQMTVLSEAHLVHAERMGRRILYHMNLDEIEEAMSMLQSLCHVDSRADIKNACCNRLERKGAERGAV